ncbi:uncharacterized protein LOC109834240 [Asparagus officinalis]|uniref:uncharacterized protein LOC109834240 n=1 Tax=Asparagus officinalis TaxID=4686 RepID=UPI00098E327C|nr:uncharacterized protein LOC109834240 [Asparagus officinalis]
MAAACSARFIPSASLLARHGPTSPSSGLAGAADHHGPPRINIWEDPMSPSKWKEEHFVLASLSGWGLLIYGGFKVFGGKNDKKDEVIPAAAS